MRRGALIVGSFLVPAVAEACPVCAQNDSARSAAEIALLVLMMAAPFVVLCVAALAIRSLVKPGEREQ